ncbi:MAG TPA: uracil-DNA glycosylase, partial [Tepidisphaeraceae bacterium]
MESSTRNRLKLWLRSERAFGLNAVAVPQRALQESAEESEETPDVVAAPAPAPLSAKPGATRMYENVSAPNEMAPRGGLVAPPSRATFTAPILSTDEKTVRLRAMDEKEVKGCPRCRLCETRTNTVFGEGDPDAPVMFIGEGPGENEDKTGRPFVGRAGELLDRQIAAMGFAREQVYIANVVKCRPPGNRQPAPDEAATCTPYLERQIEIIRPKVIVTLGLSAARYMLDTKETMGRLRGNWHTWRGIRLMPTFHPAYV